jgi:rod shape-determining protein MreD
MHLPPLRLVGEAMSIRRVLTVAFILTFGYLIQTALISTIPLPFFGPDLFLLLLFALMLQLPGLDGVIVAFGAGLLLDLAPPVDGPVGKWALVLTLVALALTPLAENVQSGAPMAALGVIALATSGTIALSYVVSSILGEARLEPGILLSTILGITIWNIVFAPWVMMMVRRTMRGTSTIEVLR